MKGTILTFSLAAAQIKREVNVNVKAKKICNKNALEFIISTSEVRASIKFYKN